MGACASAPGNPRSATSATAPTDAHRNVFIESSSSGPGMDRGQLEMGLVSSKLASTCQGSHRLLQRGEGERANDVALGDDEDGQHRSYHEHAPRHDHVPA